jgi:hypothetical protein
VFTPLLLMVYGTEQLTEPEQVPTGVDDCSVYKRITVLAEAYGRLVKLAVRYTVPPARTFVEGAM